MNDMDSQGAYLSCPVCDSAFTVWRTKKTKGKDYKIDRCLSCGYAFVNPRPSLAFLKHFYAYQGNGKSPLTLDHVLAEEARYPNSTLDASRMVAAIRSHLSSTNGNLLDVGCGYGFFSKEAVDQSFCVTAIELSSNERVIAKEMAGVDAVDISFEEIPIPPSSFSALLMSQILEHAHDVNFWISKARAVLIEGGIIAIALPNFGSITRMLLNEDEPYICPPEHLNFFGPKSLSQLLVRHGFEVVQIDWISRIPVAALEKRLPKAAKKLAPLAGWTTEIGLRMVDAARLGMIINVYGRKIGTTGALYSSQLHT